MPKGYPNAKHENVVDGVLTHTKDSPTAASRQNPLFGPSGVIPYRVLMQSAVGTNLVTVVEAATGDEAAMLALANHPGAKVAHIEPAPRVAL